MKFSIKDFFSKCDKTADLVIFTEKIHSGKLHFLCSQKAEKIQEQEKMFVEVSIIHKSAAR